MTESIGFTGTRSLRNDDQEIIERIVDGLPKGARVVTGGCIGVDAMVATLAYQNGHHVHTVLPADRSRVDPDWPNWCQSSEEMPRGSTYKHRNQRIVDRSTRLIAIPEHAERDLKSLRSGTWQTIRLARKDGKPVDVHILCSECRPTTPEAPSDD